MLIRNARLLDGRAVDVRIADDNVTAISHHDPASTEDATIIEAGGGLLIPGLHDHHVHVAATAAALASVPCGPPEVLNREDLVSALYRAAGTGWLRGIGYHESVAGDLDRAWIDAVIADRPVRIQHRSGRMWIFNSLGLERLRSATNGASPTGLDLKSGQLFDEDEWLRSALGSSPPEFRVVAERWARWGVTGLTDMNPQNDRAAAGHFARQQAGGSLPQRIVLAGLPELASAPAGTHLTIGPVKVHLHEARLPDYDALVVLIREAHAQGRKVAVHCVTETELAFTLAALSDAGAEPGDRIEHASVAPDALVAEIALLNLTVVTQPNFVAERGDTYLAAIDQQDWPSLYRLRAFRKANVTLAGGTDAPFGAADPWAAMAAAVSRRTRGGLRLSPQEALTPEEALNLFLADPHDLSRTRNVEVGIAADLCLLTQDWAALRENIGSADVQASFIGGRLVHLADPVAVAVERTGRAARPPA